jgi:hypothetical protein
VPSDRLYDVCRSLPFPADGCSLDWGHNFEGLCLQKNKTLLPWEERSMEGDVDGQVYHDADLNPYDVTEIEELPLSTPGEPPKARHARAKTTQANCFSKLPEEICVLVASYLPTSDVLSLRRAVRSFVAIFHRPQFWATRFTLGGDRSWVFESMAWEKASDWRWIYRLTNNSHQSGGMRNRKRVWKLAQTLQDILTLRTSNTLIPTNTPTTAEREFPCWRTVTGDLREQIPLGPYLGFGEGCRAFHKSRVTIPGLVDRLLFSTVSVGDSDYIAGMTVVLADGKIMELGYRSKETEFPLHGSALLGLDLAVGSRGIQGIRCILENNEESGWFGARTRYRKRNVS